ncbi:sensor histidine kinase [Bradyrhizobium sp. CB2312]|uniref:sensor histidine kinase n=1 Tax=Bradyrhizobium sp. CB2312 TaxID=3039155 RepID=UPI0024B1D71F|nr:sensor histidine kinase [Bradyrhizobium sp. CB2312]WFU72916.1 sensor histidine kinase [Bradyrhizobium sp. CB2312]
MAALRNRFSFAAWLAGLFFCVAAVLLSSAPSFGEGHKRIIILHSFGREFRPWNEYAKAIRAELDRQSPWVLDVQEHSLVSARSNDPKAELAFVEYLGALYNKNPPDLIVVIGAPAAVFIQRYRDQLFPNIPMLITAVEQRRVQFSNLTENDAVVAVKHDFRFLFESFLRIAPETRIVGMVNGNTPNELFWQNEMRKELAPLEHRIEIRWYNTLSFEEILKQIADLPPHSAIFWFQMIVDGAGVAHEGDQAITRLYASANAPIFTTDQAFFGREIIGGPMHSPLELARRAGAVAMRILGGEKAGSIIDEPSTFAKPRYDWRELQRWGISAIRLPPGSEIYFREPGMWDRYRSQILLVAAIILVQAGLISGLLFQRSGRLRAEVQARQRSAELAHINRVAMAGELTATIAHELNQPLGAILTNVETAQLMVKSPAPDLREIDEILADIRRDDVRASEVIGRLRAMLKRTPLEFKDVDLNDVADEALQFLSALAGARKVDLASSVAPTLLPVKGDAIQLQQVIVNLIVNAMEAMANIPPGKRRIKVSTARDGNAAHLSVTDVGPGIPTDKLHKVFEPFFTTKSEGMGMGLSIARTIVEAHNGHLSAQSDAGRGATFRITLPLAKQPSDPTHTAS